MKFSEIKEIDTNMFIMFLLSSAFIVFSIIMMNNLNNKYIEIWDKEIKIEELYKDTLEEKEVLRTQLDQIEKIYFKTHNKGYIYKRG